jgi:serine/threonine protein kinase
MILQSPFKYEKDRICIDDDVHNNTINIDNIDYFAYYINLKYKNNKGANSYVFALYQAQNFDSIEQSKPDLAIKISNKKDYKNTPSPSNKRFYREIEALENCAKSNVPNVVKIHSSGQLICKGKNTKGEDILHYFPFYVMDYASCDLKKYLEDNPIDYYNKIDLCLQIAKGLKDLKDLGYYHRDLKPDNILIFNNSTWKIGDLGLIIHRDDDELYDKKNEFIGPKGWLSPEAMNKYLYYENNEYTFDCKIDHQSDIFQLGKVFWYIFQGNVPIGGICRDDYRDKNEDIFKLLIQMLKHSKTNRLSTIDDVINVLNDVIKKQKI